MELAFFNLLPIITTLDDALGGFIVGAVCAPFVWAYTRWQEKQRVPESLLTGPMSPRAERTLP